MTRLSLEGRVFGQLTVVEFVGVKNRYSTWRCECACGRQTVTRGSRLVNGACRSCGCLKGRKLKHGSYSKFGRMPSEFQSWLSMWIRCTQPSHRSYSNYGGRGIAVCSRWRDYNIFMVDMGPKPGLEYTLDRIDVDGPYSPENCRWATNAEQQRNKRTNRQVTAFGETFCLAEWGRRYNLRPETISERLASGWEAEKAVSKPSQKRRGNASPQEKTRTGDSV